MARRELAERVALVTGASRRDGIGAATCRALAADGADVVFTSWNAYDQAFPWEADEAGPAALLAELHGLGVRSAAVEIDLAAPQAARRLLDLATQRIGLPVILVNNAAHSTNGGYETLDAAALDAHYEVNVRTTALLCVEFARRHTKAGRRTGGRIINLSSGQGRGPMPEELAYATSKGAIEVFTVSLAAGVARLGITVNAVNPGPTDTGWMTEEIKQALLSRFPFGRLGQPADAARLITFLAGDAGAWITGQILHSEGGFER